MPARRQTRAQTPADVRMRWKPDGRLLIPSDSQPDVWRTTDSRGCDCPSRVTCWHIKHRAKLRDGAVQSLTALAFSDDEIVEVLGRKFPELRRMMLEGRD